MCHRVVSAMEGIISYRLILQLSQGMSHMTLRERVSQAERIAIAKP